MKVAATNTLLFLCSTSVLLSSPLRALSTLRMSTPKHIVVVGGGVQGSSVAYFLSKHKHNKSDDVKVTILESQSIASAASGKGGGFMARSWGDGGSTQQLHHLAFDLYEELAPQLGCTTYRKLPVLSVQPGKGGVAKALKSNKVKSYMPGWLDGNIGGANVMGRGDDTAQITPREFTNKLLEACSESVSVVYGTVTGVETNDDNAITGVRYTAATDDDASESVVMDCDALVVSAGPWSCAAEDWFEGISLPMEGVKSTSIVFQSDDQVDATALFCGEDYRFGTHLEVYPRPDGTIYLCGIGGSEYISTQELKAGAYRDECNANPTRVQAASDSFREMSASFRSSCSGPDVTQACMRPCPPDALPYMGPIPGYGGAFINAGHNCWGIAWAPACGKAMAELVLDGHSSSVDLSPFDPSRFSVKRSGGRGRKKKGSSVGEQW
mmetsp:Transcript_16808/g.26225  ORF Transcript_16808/g.26225 Transcript_16808/m.26225 type:complete len:439 (+) Transcript_16808:64-1380(+)